MTEPLFKDQLAEVSEAERTELLTDFLRNETARRLDIDPSEIEPRGPLMNLGMSSLKAFELKLYLEEQLGFRLRSSLLFDYPTLETLVPFLLSKLAPAASSGEEPQNIEAELARELESSI
jgi:myxalamid-type polyketide synthase MxaB